MCSDGHDGPSAVRNRASVSIGVGCGASVTRGSDVNDARAVATTRSLYLLADSRLALTGSLLASPKPLRGGGGLLAYWRRLLAR